jgi:sugar/nucleoside kinase (ribokinase family)
MRAACALAIRKSVPLWIEPVSYDKAALVMSAEIIQHAFCIHPNLEELAVMATELGLHRFFAFATPSSPLLVCDPAVFSEGTSIGMGDIYRLGDAVMAATNIKARVDFILCFPALTHALQNIFVTLGAGGCCFMSEDSNPIVFPSFLKPSKVLSTSGAGDSSFGALIAVYTAMESWKEAAAAGSGCLEVAFTLQH